MNTEDDEFARIAREQALNKKADNARELGLDYEPDIPFGDNNPGLQWDEVPQAFNDWWNADYDPTGNPFEKDTHAYWAWAGWKAAEQPAQQEHVVDSSNVLEWTPCMKLPVVVHVRKQRPGEAHVSTREGITPVKPDDLIMRGVSGEEYPIGRAIFEQTYSLEIKETE